jgi:multiple sugar transport system permease protein
VSIFPWPFSTESYKGLLTMTNYPTYFKNSVIVAVGTTIITVFTVCPLSYILTRLRIRFAGTFVRLMLVAYMFPALLLTIPMFVIFTKVGLFDTLTSVMIGQSTLTIPLGVWLMWGFFKGIPFELEEAALIDGSTPFGAFIKIVLPLSRAGLITTALFTFILSWTDYIYAFTLIFSDELKTLPIGLADIYGATDMRWGELMAGSALITIPSVLAFAFVTRYLVQGLTAGAVKG